MDEIFSNGALGAQGANVLQWLLLEGLIHATVAAEDLTTDVVLPNPAPPQNKPVTIDIMVVLCCLHD